MIDGITRLSRFLFAENIKPAAMKFGIGRCICGYHDPSIHNSNFSKAETIRVMPTYTAGSEIVGDCLYGPGLCDLFDKCFRGYFYNEIVMVRV